MKIESLDNKSNHILWKPNLKLNKKYKMKIIKFHNCLKIILYLIWHKNLSIYKMTLNENQFQ